MIRKNRIALAALLSAVVTLAAGLSKALVVHAATETYRANVTVDERERLQTQEIADAVEDTVMVGLVVIPLGLAVGWLAGRYS